MERLERAWNSANGVAFGEPFSTDADFVAIRGDLHTGRDAIAEGHQQILDTIYAGSTARYEVLQARELDDRVILAHARCTVNAPGGPSQANSRQPPPSFCSSETSGTKSPPSITRSSPAELDEPELLGGAAGPG